MSDKMPTTDIEDLRDYISEILETAAHVEADLNNDPELAWAVRGFIDRLNQRVGPASKAAGIYAGSYLQGQALFIVD